MTVLVVGGGIGGLAAAYELGRAGVPVTLVEASSRLGGKIGTERVSGYLVERGPDSFLAVTPTLVDLCRELGLESALIKPLPPSSVFVWRDGRGLVPLPEGAGAGAPRALRQLVLSPLFSLPEKIRIARELLMPAGTATEDEAVGTFLRRRFGAAFVDRLASPLFEGLYGAPIDELSLLALAPRLRETERRHGGLLRAVFAARGVAGTTPMPALPLLSLAAGMGSLVSAIVERLERTEVILDTAVIDIECAGQHYRARLSDDRRISCDAVIVATPAPAAARLLEGLLPSAARALGTIPHGSTAAVYLGYQAAGVTNRLNGHGFLAPSGVLAFSACSWTSSKWPDRAPRGAVLLRASVRDARLLAAEDATVVDAVHKSLALTIGVHEGPEFVRVERHEGVMPRYSVGHLERVAAIEAALAEQPSIQVIGAAYRGVGVPECAAQGRRAAQQLLAGVRLEGSEY